MNLPTDISNLIGSFAYGGSPKLEKDLIYVLANRGMIPDPFLSMRVRKLDLDMHRYPRAPLEYFHALNPLRTDNPFYPWSLISRHAEIFSDTFTYWVHSLSTNAYRELKTYPKTFERHCRTCAMSGKGFGHNWNHVFQRYLQSDALQKLENYEHHNYTGLFIEICYCLQTAGFVSP